MPSSACKKKDAVSRLEHGEHFDVILLDVAMPATTGIQIYESLLAQWPDQAAKIVFFCFNDTTTTVIYTLSLHDALPISTASNSATRRGCSTRWSGCRATPTSRDRKSTRLNSSHVEISYAVFCLKKK